MHIGITSQEHFVYICKNQIFLHGRVFSEKYALPKKILHYNVLYCSNCLSLESVFYISPNDQLLLFEYLSEESITVCSSNSSSIPTQSFCPSLPEQLLCNHITSSTPNAFFFQTGRTSRFFFNWIIHILDIIQIYKGKTLLLYSLPDHFSYGFQNSVSQQLLSTTEAVPQDTDCPKASLPCLQLLPNDLKLEGSLPHNGWCLPSKFSAYLQHRFFSLHLRALRHSQPR